MRFSITNEEFVKKVKEIFPDLEILSSFKWVSDYILVKTKFGICNCKAISILKRHYPSIVTAVNKTEYFINKAIAVHGDKYDYSKTIYTGVKEPVIITCPIHGHFTQMADSHLQNKSCPKCARENSTNSAREQATGWQHSDWIAAGSNSPNFNCFMLYIIKMYNQEEVFYKIGKTFIGITKRFAKHNIKYNIDTIYTLCEDGKFISQLEDYLKSENKEFKYIPKMDFGGMYECFSEIKNIENIDIYIEKLKHKTT